MAEGELIKAWGAGCAWQFVITLIVMFVLLGGLGCLAAWLPFWQSCRFLRTCVYFWESGY